MTKTKIRVSPTLLDYWKMMKESVNDLRDQKLQIATNVKNNMEPYEPIDFLKSDWPGLFVPPGIECMRPEFYLTDDGGVEGIIQLITTDYYGIFDISLTLKDETGKLLESGHAWLAEDSLGHWVYLPTVAPPLGSTVIVRAVAVDALGAMSTREESCIVGESDLERDYPGEMAG